MGPSSNTRSSTKRQSEPDNNSEVFEFTEESSSDTEGEIREAEKPLVINKQQDLKTGGRLLRPKEGESTVEQSQNQPNVACFMNKILSIIAVIIAIIAVIIGSSYILINITAKQDHFDDRLNDFIGKYSEEIHIPLGNCVNESKFGHGPCTALILHTSLGIEKAESVVNDLAQVGEKITPEAVEPLWFTSRNFTRHLEDYSVVEFCQKKMKQKKIMVLKELHEMEGEILRQFHSVCDPYAVKKDDSAVFIFTMLDKSQSRGTNPRQKAHETMTTLWGNTLEDNVLEPLITRFTNVVVYISDIN